METKTTKLPWFNTSVIGNTSLPHLISNSLQLDYLFWIRNHWSSTEKCEFLAKKYYLVALHAARLRSFKLGRSAMRLRGRRVYYESSLGFADYQSILTRHELMVSECQLQDGGTVVDLGANVGYFSLLLAERFPHARIIAFEPVRRTFRCLSRNTAGFSNVEAHNMAVSNFAGQAFMRFDELECQTSQLTSSPTAEAVDVDTLDHVLSDYGVTNVDLLKIDVENAEKFVLQGARTMLANTRYLLIEINIVDNPNYTFSDLVSQLYSDTYNFQLVALRNFSNVAEGRIPVGDFLFENVRYRPPEERR